MYVPNSGLTQYLKTNQIPKAIPLLLAAITPLIAHLPSHVHLHRQVIVIIHPPAHREVAVEVVATLLRVPLAVAHQAPQAEEVVVEGKIIKNQD
jgi:hypothetical protein